MPDYTQDMPPELAAEQMRIARRRQLAEAMLAQSQRQQPISHWTQGLAQLANAHWGKQKAEAADAEQRALGDKYAQGRDAEMAKITSAMAPQPAIGPDEQGVGPTRPEMPAPQEKVRQALIAAQQSAYPQVRGFGAGQQKWLEADQSRDANIEARNQQLRDAAELRAYEERTRAKERAEEAEKNDKRDAATRERDIRLAASLRQSGSSSDNVKVIDNGQGGLTVLDARGNIIKTHETGGKITPAFIKAENAKIVKGETSANTVSEVDNALSLLDKGIFAGTGAEFFKGVNKAGGLAGKDTGKASRTEQYLSSIGNVIVPNMKALGANPTDRDLTYMQKISAGEINLEPETMRQVLLRIKGRYGSQVMQPGAPTTLGASSGGGGPKSAADYIREAGGK